MDYGNDHIVHNPMYNVSEFYWRVPKGQVHFRSEGFISCDLLQNDLTIYPVIFIFALIVVAYTPQIKFLLAFSFANFEN